MPEKGLPTTNRDYPSPFSVRLNPQERNERQRLTAGQPGKPKSLEKYKTTQLELPFVLPSKHRGQYSRTINLYDAIPKYFGDILYSLCQQKIFVKNIGQIGSLPENVHNGAMAAKVSAVLFHRRTYDLIVTFIRSDLNMQIHPSFLIQILKFGREAQYCPHRGLSLNAP